jgi:hypothetical protein
LYSDLLERYCCATAATSTTQRMRTRLTRLRRAGLVEDKGTKAQRVKGEAAGDPVRRFAPAAHGQSRRVRKSLGDNLAKRHHVEQRGCDFKRLVWAFNVDSPECASEHWDVDGWQGEPRLQLPS